MKKPKQLILFGLFAFFFTIIALDFTGCKHDDQVIEEWVPPTIEVPPTN